MKVRRSGGKLLRRISHKARFGLIALRNVSGKQSKEVSKSDCKLYTAQSSAMVASGTNSMVYVLGFGSLIFVAPDHGTISGLETTHRCGY